MGPNDAVLELGAGWCDFANHVVAGRVVAMDLDATVQRAAAVHGTRVARVAVPQLAQLDAALGPRQRSLLDAFLPEAQTADRLTLAPEMGPTGDF